MKYIMYLLQLSNYYVVWIAGGTIAILALVMVVNMTISPYLRHNRAVSRSIKQLAITAKSGKIIPFVNSIPVYYRPQWKCYTTTRCVNASQLFTVIAPRPTFYLWRLFLIGNLLVVWLGMVFYYHNSEIALYTVVGYGFLVIPLILVSHLVKKCHYQHSKRLSNRYISMIEACFGKGDIRIQQQCSDENIANTIEQIRLMADSHDNALQRVGSLLASKPIDKERTVKQQQSINKALNQLLTSHNNK